MSKSKISIDPAIYATQFLFRRDMIWRAMTAAGDNTVKDPIAYLNRKEKKFGEIIKEAASLAYQELPKNCLAVVETRIDEILSERHGWQTIEAWRKSGMI